MKSSIFRRIFKSYLIIVLVVTVFLTLYNSTLIRRFYLQILTRDLTNIGYSLKPQVYPLIARHDVKALQALVRAVGQETDVRITIINQDGTVLADSHEEPAAMEDHWNRPEVIEALAGRVGTSARYSDTLKQEMFYVALPGSIKNNGAVVIRASLFLTDVNAFLSSMRTNVFYVGVLAALLSLLYAFFVSRQLSKPVKELARATSKVAEGDFETKVVLKNKDELEELANHFNDMTLKVKELFEENLRRKERLELVISSMHDGLVLFGRDGKVAMVNDSFKQIARTRDLIGKSYWEIGSFQLGALIKKATTENRNLSDEMEINNKTFLVSATVLPGDEGTLVLSRDVTGVRHLQDLKRDLVANVSHELRTPLTALKGFLETLEQERNAQKKREYLGIIKKHVDRLINIVHDLLVLSQLESDDAKLEIEDVNLPMLLNNIIHLFKGRLQERGLALKYNEDEKLPPVKADPFKLEQMFFNLLDNAIKYTEKGQITISMRQHDDTIQLQVADTGIGIPKADIPRIFERFYVVDKSRSRSLGGTGLGLSIVKHIVLLHGGTIHVDSTHGAGTTFTVSLPILTKN